MKLRTNAYPGIMWLLFAAAVVFATGMAFLWPLTTLYIRDVLGKSLTTAGVVLLFNQGGFLVGSLIGGVLFDRWGKRRTLLTFTMLALLAAFGMGMWQDLWIYGVLLTVTGLCSGVIYPGMYALAGVFWPEGGRKGINLVYVAVNVGVALGSALGGLVATLSFQWTFYGNGFVQVAVLLLFSLMLTKGHLQNATSPSVVNEEPQPVDASGMLRMSGGKSHLPIMMLCTGLLILWVVYVQWQSNLAPYIQSFGLTLADYSMLWTLNGAMILCGQPVISWVIKRFARTLHAQILLGSYIFVCSMLILSQASTYAAFFTAMLVMTLGEMLVWPGVPTIASELAPPGREGWYQGMVSGASSAGRMIGPLLGAILMESLSPMWMIVIMAACCLIAVFFFSQYKRFAKTGSELGIDRSALTR
ncbi:MAG TPA: MFS transporter [Candidatus Bathyarchaeia archaeon]|nr:MFS transporter [Candidatus Bathyarchaeia archaeon]